MADNVIGDYDAAVSIDGSTHYLLIQPGNSSTAYNKINRNVLLGVTGQPADISTAQSLSNKTIDSTNSATLLDNAFTLQDNSDPTKQAQFQLSGITAGQTRTYTLPDASGTIVDLATAQTLTNKTLTSPAITGGTLANSTITVDSIAEYTSANGVSIDGLNIKDGKLNTANSVVTASYTDGSILPEHLVAGTGTGWPWASWTPSWTNFTATSATISATYTQIGKTVLFRLSVLFGASTAVSGNIVFSLPVTAQQSTLTWIGSGHILDAGTTVFRCDSFLASATTAAINVSNAAGTYLTATAVTSSTVPMTWAVNDAFVIQGMYEAA